MRSLPLLSLLLAVVLTGSAPAQAIFSGKKPAPAAPATTPAVTITKSGSAPAAADSDVRSSGRKATPRNDANAAQPADSNTGNAVFRPGDSIDMRISGIPNEDAGAFPSPVTIGADGNVNITYAGQIRAAGLNQGQLERAIEKRFVDEKIFRWPTVTITVLNQQRAVTVGGAVRGPGRQPWTADLTLMSAIMAAGGPGDFASDKVNVIRNGTATQFRIKQLNKNPADDPKLLPGDRVELQQ